jgi:proline racemase/trans-L-3-hydroxyproline dehydratase
MKFERMFSAIDSHTGGNAERVIVGGVPQIPGRTMMEKLKYTRDNLDHLRTLLVHEPRGHNNMFASFLLPPTVDGADVGVLYLEPGGYPTMCGHGTIGVCTVLVETGMVEVEEPITEVVLDTAAGVVRAEVAVKDGLAESVTIRNVPSFLYKADVEVNVPDVGRVVLDIAYGGNFYAILPAEAVGLEIDPQHDSEIISLGTRIWRAANEQVDIHHPEEPEIDSINYVEFSAPATDPKATMKNAVAVPPAGIDRSPCGTGTSAKMATLYAKGELGLNEEFVHESIIGSLFYGELVEETKVGDYTAVIPTIRGSAHIMGIHQFVLDPRDPFPAGFLLGKQEKLYGVGFEL